MDMKREVVSGIHIIYRNPDKKVDAVVLQRMTKVQEKLGREINLKLLVLRQLKALK